MTILIGPDSEAQERYLDALSYAEHCHLVSLAKRRCAILMAPSIPLGLYSMPASGRRGRSLTPAETEKVRRDFAPESGVIAIYEPMIDALVMPTARAVRDPEHAVLHELGHALTYSRIDEIDPALLSLSLPPDIVRHLDQPGYRGDSRGELAELMAEAYARIVVGRIDELAPQIVSALHAILPLDVEFFEDPL